MLEYWRQRRKYWGEFFAMIFYLDLFRGHKRFPPQIIIHFHPSIQRFENFRTVPPKVFLSASKDFRLRMLHSPPPPFPVSQERRLWTGSCGCFRPSTMQASEQAPIPCVNIFFPPSKKIVPNNHMRINRRQSVVWLRGNVCRDHSYFLVGTCIVFLDRHRCRADIPP